ncbi:hypothetical protein FB45DRAFT_933704 [Roridomyces roridus]|uniref:RING-type domain-containing protein n=1 Tax=Roridomyces roridus TaxID=1738132 RepID=A0AAD7BCX9_9AGAR|nr:hypothetical protein FB45DRAFT_933704 [Roridomyces roridus]
MPRKTRSGTITNNDVGLWLDETAFALQNDEDEYMQFSLNLGAENDSDVASMCSTPPRLRLDVDAVQRQRKQEKKVSGDCGICFEYATSPVQAECCAQIFCAEHLSRWLQGPASDGLCPACRTPSSAVPRSVTSPTEIVSPLSAISPLSSITASSSTSAQTILSASSWRSTHTQAEESKTDCSFPALTQARIVQSRRHTVHSVGRVGLQGALSSLMRVFLGVLFVTILAARGRWAAAEL